MGSSVIMRQRVELARRVSVPVRVAVAVLDQDLHRVVGTRLRAPIGGGEGFTELEVGIPGGRQISRDVRLGFGPPLEEDGVTAVPVWWEDAEHPALFPTFDGGLEVHDIDGGTELRLVGSYRPPLGAVGRFADGLLGRRIVAGSLDAFLAAVADRLTRAASAESPV
jgi:hypothetical protein